MNAIFTKSWIIFLENLKIEYIKWRVSWISLKPQFIDVKKCTMSQGLVTDGISSAKYVSNNKPIHIPMSNLGGKSRSIIEKIMILKQINFQFEVTKMRVFDLKLMQQSNLQSRKVE